MEKNKHFISICIPTYNREEFLSETLQSILLQTYTNFELIIINDASTDGTERIIRSVEDKRIRYFKSPENLGYIRSMNKGTKLARGEWIMHVSDDDRMRPTMLEEMISAIADSDANTIGFVVPQSANINAKGMLISEPRMQLNGKKYLLLKPKEFIYNFTLYGKKVRNKYQFNTSFPSTLFNKKILIELGMSSSEVPVSHDILIESKICLLYPVIVIDHPLFEYRIHENWGSSLNQKGTFLKEYLKFLDLLFIFIAEEKISFDYDFRKYCFDSLISYLFSLDGGVIRTAARFKGSNLERVRHIFSYILFGLRNKKLLLISPQFYLSSLASFLPQTFILSIGRATRKV